MICHFYMVCTYSIANVHAMHATDITFRPRRIICCQIYHNHIANRGELEVPTGVPPKIQPSHTACTHARNRSAQSFNSRLQPMPSNSSHACTTTTPSNRRSHSYNLNSFSYYQYNSPFCRTSTNPSTFNLGNEPWQATVLAALALSVP